jgi:Protein of unknown function (DUF3443)/Protein of unknown function (DUF2844)
MTSKVRLTSLALFLLAVSVPAAATLGEDASSVRADQAQMQGTLQIAAAAKFKVHEIQLPSGGVVKEYVSPAANSFDWGLPFFYGRNVYTAIDAANTPAGPGPYIAF